MKRMLVGYLIVAVALTAIVCLLWLIVPEVARTMRDLLSPEIIAGGYGWLEQVWVAAVVVTLLTLLFCGMYYRSWQRLRKIAEAPLSATQECRECQEDAKGARVSNAVSLIYLHALGRRNTYQYIALLISGVFSAMALAAAGARLSLVPTAVAGFIALVLWAKSALIEYRVRAGVFGTNAYEAWQLIRFVLRNSTRVDFTNHDGSPIPALLPEAVRPEASTALEHTQP